MEQTINFLIRFLSENEFLYFEFREDVHLLIAKHIEKDIHAKIVAWFLSESYLKHLEQIKRWSGENYVNILPYNFNGHAYQRLINIGYTKGYVKEVTEFIIWCYSNSNSYNNADIIYAYLVSPNLEKLTREQITDLCEKVNSNSQAYGRKRAGEDHKELKKHIERNINELFEFSKYKNVFE